MSSRLCDALLDERLSACSRDPTIATRSDDLDDLLVWPVGAAPFDRRPPAVR
ncbi:MAG: hypothetical protein OXD37_07815 [Acidimicrobiaceae bacterium]|nr:hypothetical protein [Acidimicrobiaceae bacterium]